MKKFLSILMVLVMILSFSVTAFAADTDGSITITNATINETYAVYKIFDASISKDNAGVTNAVSYSIKTNNQFFATLFGADGTADNTYFVYNADTGTVTKKENVNDAELVKYLTDMVAASTYTTATTPVTATSNEVKFENLSFGYYLITSTLGATVTINSNTPDVSVIDKNQKPGGAFEKYVQDGVDTEGNPIWAESNSANIGDQVTYKISFEATNYDGDKKIKFYSINDEKGDAIWADFESFEVYVGGVKLNRGYYLAQGGDNTDNWEFLGDWSGVADADKNCDNAEWYLVHLDYDKFRISIPWLEGYSIEEMNNIHSIKFPENAAFKFDSPVVVEVIYDAVIEENAAIGDNTHGNRYNKAYASWTSENESGSTKPEEVVTRVYGIGLLKDDIATGVNLAGAKFRIYRDEDCTVPVYVIPTKIKGVYIVDSLGTALDAVSGSKKKVPREIYEEYLEDYLGENVQDNYVVSQVNGKLAILGLKEGSYFLKEVEAPNGYNALTQPIEIKAGEGTSPFLIYADASGNVADIQQANATYTESRYDITSTVVHNSKGVVLPSTGGTGTVWLITIGTLLAIGFAVFLITHKKMSVYND